MNYFCKVKTHQLIKGSISGFRSFRHHPEPEVEPPRDAKRRRRASRRHVGDVRKDSDVTTLQTGGNLIKLSLAVTKLECFVDDNPLQLILF